MHARHSFLSFLMLAALGSILSSSVQAQTQNEISKLLASDGAASDNFGLSVSVSGDYAIVGALFDVDNGLQSGSAYVFYRHQGGTDTWGQVAKLLASDSAAGENFGKSVSISGDYAIVAAYGYGSGAAYVFYRNQGGTDTWGQVTKLLASDGAAGDIFSQSVSIFGDYAIIGAPGDTDNGIYSGSAYVFYRHQGGTDTWGQVTKLLASDGAASQSFGYSVAISGDYAIVGGKQDADNGIESGAAYVFYRHQGGTDTWGQVTKLLASDGAAGDNFGFSVSVSGDYAIIGAFYDADSGLHTGSAYVFYRNQGGTDTWGQVTKLLASNGAAGDVFGCSVSISGDYAIIGAEGDDYNNDVANSGAAYVFYRNQGGNDTWGQVTKVTAGDYAIGDTFGRSVSISGDYAIAGAHRDADNGSGSGSAYVIRAVPPNVAPVWVARADTSTAEGVPVVFTVSAADADGDSLTYSAPSLPVGATFDAETRLFVWIPTYSQAGIDTAIFSVTDARATVYDTVSISVADVPPALSVLTLPTMDIVAGGTIVIPIHATLHDAYSIDMAFTVDSDIVTPDAAFIQGHVFDHQQNSLAEWNTIGDTIIISLAAENFQSITIDNEIVTELVFHVDSSMAPGSVVPLTWLPYPQTNVNEDSADMYNGELSVPIPYGDASQDGSISAYDASLILQYVVRLLPEINVQLADVTGNGFVSGFDAAWVLYKTVNPGVLFPIEGGVLPKISADGVRTLSWINTGTEWHLVANNPRGIMAGQISLAVQGDAVHVVGSDLTISKQDGSVLNVAFARLDSNDPVLLRLESESTLTGAPRILGAQFNEGAVLWTEALPTQFALEQNSPNPFNPSTTIRFAVVQGSPVRLMVYNTAGQLVRTLVDRNMEAGAHQVVWNGSDESGRRVSSGVYLYRLTSAEGAMVRKMLLVR
jgi:hypothetical protein